MTAPVKVDHGVYTVKQGETLLDVAQNCYNDQQRLKWVLEANPDCEFLPGDRVTIPNKKGTLLTAQANDGITFMLQRDLPGRAPQQYLELIFRWNGGKGIDIEEGDVIFVPDRQDFGY